MRSFENVIQDNIEWLRSDACELGFQHMTDIGIISPVTKQNEEEGGEDESEEEGENREHKS
jgi:hypothetical protein